MDIIARLAIIFAGFIVGGVFLNIYYAVCCFFTIFLLRIDSESILVEALYWLCLAAGFVTSFLLMRKVWPKTPVQWTNSAEEESGTPPDAPHRTGLFRT